MKVLRRDLILSIISAIALFFWFSLPAKLFDSPVSDVLYSSDGRLLGARISGDGQWRFPSKEDVNEKFAESLIAFEDKRFWNHPGIDPMAIARAAMTNLSSGRVRSGGSTISMQVIRMYRENRRRTYWEKILEGILTLRMELTWSKREILSAYAANAPFGGNVVGIEAACWRYLGHNSSSLSWSEAATLAVLPNSPSLIHISRNRDRLKLKRDALLYRLHKAGKITEQEYELALLEPLAGVPRQLPDYASHLFERLRKEGYNGRIGSTLDYSLQRQVNEIVDRYVGAFESNKIYNCGVIVAEVATGRIIAYTGNPSGTTHGRRVDMVTAERSTGSLLKPVLYAAMLDDGLILPRSLVTDIPLYIDGFSPQNYNKSFRGVVPADEAISRSLNVPLVRMLVDYDYSLFHNLLREIGLKSIRHNADHYGASIILGGAESTLLDMSAAYASMARRLNSKENGKGDFRPLCAVEGQHPGAEADFPGNTLTRASLWYAFRAMSNVNRPEEESEWSSFSSMKRVAWKTGTSYGARDAWAIGANPDYVVGVWVGNANGEGRAGLTGVGYAAPVMFDIFSLLPSSAWFSEPTDEMEEMEVCRKSGFRASPHCDVVDTLRMPKMGLNSPQCHFHKTILLDPSGMYRANADCFPASSLVERSWFVLSPAQEWYYRAYNGSYAGLPSYHPDCMESQMKDKIEIVYPVSGTTIVIARGFDGLPQKFVARASYMDSGEKLHWHLNGLFIGTTEDEHTMAFIPDNGKNELLITDECGNTASVRFSGVTDGERW